MISRGDLASFCDRSGDSAPACRRHHPRRGPIFAPPPEVLATTIAAATCPSHGVPSGHVWTTLLVWTRVVVTAAASGSKCVCTVRCATHAMSSDDAATHPAIAKGLATLQRRLQRQAALRERAADATAAMPAPPSRLRQPLAVPARLLTQRLIHGAVEARKREARAVAPRLPAAPVQTSTADEAPVPQAAKAADACEVAPAVPVAPPVAVTLATESVAALLEAAAVAHIEAAPTAAAAPAADPTPAGTPPSPPRAHHHPHHHHRLLPGGISSSNYYHASGDSFPRGFALQRVRPHRQHAAAAAAAGGGVDAAATAGRRYADCDDDTDDSDGGAGTATWLPAAAADSWRVGERRLDPWLRGAPERTAATRTRGPSAAATAAAPGRGAFARRVQHIVSRMHAAAQVRRASEAAALVHAPAAPAGGGSDGTAARAAAAPR